RRCRFPCGRSRPGRCRRSCSRLRWRRCGLVRSWGAPSDGFNGRRCCFVPPSLAVVATVAAPLGGTGRSRLPPLLLQLRRLAQLVGLVGLLPRERGRLVLLARAVDIFDRLRLAAEVAV